MMHIVTTGTKQGMLEASLVPHFYQCQCTCALTCMYTSVRSLICLSKYCAFVSRRQVAHKILFPVLEQGSKLVAKTQNCDDFPVNTASEPYDMHQVM
jgi:hypothetical protein